ncbi:hypothetical protein B0H15DRAFT_850307 [Mycena belliarum]|uniref:Uncharacterized protein n=1 Tax=Mycena belliarum TaxID=1033014 RepID=A0AAD6XM01_9AGAR|nr:hypothetical protein B0H15DRAFT_850307 [Mycena belliae]
MCRTRSCMARRLPANFARALRPHHTDAGLGVRSARPPDTPPAAPRPPDDDQPVSDHEWTLRTARAADVLTRTLPSFFATGLVDAPTLYSPAVRLAYTPPAPLPAPLPRTLHVEGFSLYLASSVFVRHTLNALYADLAVALNKVALAAPPAHREKSLFIGLTVTGVARVSGAPGEWEVNSTYTFSPLTGLIHVHTVNSIHPAPHHAVYDALRAALRLPVFSPPGVGPGRPGGAAGAVQTPTLRATVKDR